MAIKSNEGGTTISFVFPVPTTTAERPGDIGQQIPAPN
jgi:hypothetical protein